MTTCHRESSLQCINLKLSLQLFPTTTFEYSLFTELYRRVKIRISSFESEFTRIVRCIVWIFHQDILISPRIWSEKREILIKYRRIIFIRIVEIITQKKKSTLLYSLSNERGSTFLFYYILLNTHVHSYICAVWKQRRNILPEVEDDTVTEARGVACFHVERERLLCLLSRGGKRGPIITA